MLYVAESAKDKIAELKGSESLAEDFFVRVSVTSGGCSGLTYNMDFDNESKDCLLYTSPSPRDATLSRMPSSA